MHDDIQKIISTVIKEAMPDRTVRDALGRISFNTKGRLIMIAAGKAAWEMARTASEVLKDRIDTGCVITKYGHAGGTLGKLRIFEAGHPFPDSNSYAATDYVLSLVEDLSENDNVLFLLSGGGSALFEKPLIAAEEMSDITSQLLSCGASITEINTVRKRLSAVKGGKFALACMPARVYTVAISDVIGDAPDMIASGPACPDPTTTEQAMRLIEKYQLKMSEQALALMRTETPKQLDNAEILIGGSVRQLCVSAERVCRELGYETVFLTDRMCCEAREAGSLLSSIAVSHQGTKHSLAYIAGGETVVHVTGNGKGGRCQETVLSAAKEIAVCRDTVIFSFGSDGTDGPTDAAGGYADEHTAEKLRETGLSAEEALECHDSYNALKAVNGLIVTGPTGTNVNDLSIVLIRR